MKNLKFTFFLLFISGMSFSQMGIGTNTPATGSILELKAADKGLLLTRVATTAAVTTPVNGMMVYDISTNCIKGYQNGAWTGCLSACATTPVASGGEFGLDFTSTVNQIVSDGTTSGMISTDKKVFLWGYNTYTEFWDNNPAIVSNSRSTPVYKPLPNGELAEKLTFTHQSGREAALVLTSSGKIYVMGLPNYGNIATISPTAGGVWTQVTLTAEPNGFIDLGVNGSSTYKILIGKSGKAYNGSSLNNPAVQIPFPAGVTAFTKVWADNLDASISSGVFFKGNNNNIYALDDNSGNYIGVGNSTAIVLNSTPQKVLFPTGVNIVSISTSKWNNLALADDGTAYGFGLWRSGTSPAFSYNFAASPIAANVVSNVIMKPSRINLPTSNGDTKFIALYSGPYQSIVQTDKQTYVKGYNAGRIFMNPIVGNNVDLMATNYDDADGANYNLASPVLNSFKFFEFEDTGSGAGYIYAIGNNNRAYFWGSSNAIGRWGLGGGVGNNAWVPRPIPIATGIGDPTNPNPLY
jgi:hypothetical protein